MRSEADSIAFGNAVCEVVQRETRDEEATVHLSLAGGRKTMSFHGGAAMTLFGRPQDELSHVLVHPPSLEQRDADFWWPGHNKPGDIELSLVPFVRVRGRLPRMMLERKMDYARYVAQVNAATAGAGVVLEQQLSPDSARTVREREKSFNFKVLATPRGFEPLTHSLEVR
jgi:CRISPR-associated protein NE0113 (Cas_NE0113)